MLRPKELEKIRKKISVENDELDCLTAMCYMGTGKYSKANSMLEKIGKRRNGQLPICVFFYRRAMKQQETDTMEEEKMKKRAKKIVALFLTAGILLSGTAACSNVEGMHLSGSTRELNVTKEDTGKSGDNVQMLPSDEKSDKIFADSHADFAIKAFQNSYEAGKNTMISPYSVINALAMTANGASGETLEQMESVLCGTADCSLDLLNRELQRLQSSMPKEKNNHLYTANSIWYKDSDENFVPADDFLKLNAEFYQADIFASAFDEKTTKDINRWIDRRTDGMIKDIMDQIPPYAIMYLVNAVAFEGEWQDPYEKEQVHDADFYDIDGNHSTVSMMYSEEYSFLKEEHAVGFIKPYKEGFDFVALLPDENMDIRDYISQMNGETFLKTIAQANDTIVQTGMPKFKAETQKELAEVLDRMGMHDAFDEKLADFSQMGNCKNGDNLYISRVLHRTKIEVNELGTKAGAATVVEVETMGCLEAVENVVLDRPFVYAIIDRENGIPVFIGFLEHARCALITVSRKPPCSKAATASMVVPPGEQTASFNSPGCFPVSNTIFAAPKTDWAANL